MFALLFPGQGSQFVGMGADLYKKYSSVKEIFKQVALEVARTERKETTQEAKDFENTAKEKGCDIIELSQKEQEIMKAKAKELYKKWESKYFPGLINGIQKA